MMAIFGLRSLPMRRLSCVLAVILFVTASSFAQQPDLNQLKREAISEVDSMQTLTQQMVDEIFSYAELGKSVEIGRAHSELQSHLNLVCRLLLEKKKKSMQERNYDHR